MKDEPERGDAPPPANVVTNHDRVEQQIVAQGAAVSITTASAPQIINQSSTVTIASSALDWSLLETLTEQWKKDTRDLIGQAARIDRPKLRQQLADAVAEHRIIVVLGDSGVGKSVLVKTVLATATPPGPCYCLHADEIPRLPSPMLAAAGMVHSLDELLPQQTSGWALLVLDGLERLSGKVDLRLVARAIRSMTLQDGGSPWRLLITCQIAAWNTIRRELLGYDVSLGTVRFVQVDLLTHEEIQTKASELVAIEPLLRRHDLLPIIGRAKVLDLIATAAAEIGLPDSTHWVGESSLIEWFWNDYVGGAGRDERYTNLLKELARGQADGRHFVTPVSDIANSEQIRVLPQLAGLGLIILRHDTVRFAHDLYADYARQRYLLAQILAHRTEGFYDRYAANPHWHRAIRLLGQHLLESEDEHPEGGIGMWRSLISELRDRAARSTASGDDGDGYRDGDEDVGSGTAIDLLVEAIVFSPQAERLLDRVAADLYAQGGTMLRSFLFRLAHTSVELVIVGTATWRSPQYSVWTPSVRWLARHRDDVLKLAPNEFLSIAETWLLSWRAWSSLCRPTVPNIEMVPEIGDAMIDLLDRAPAKVRNRNLLYTLVFFCASDHRTRVVPLFLRLSGRAKQDDQAPSTSGGVGTDVPERLRYLFQPTFVNVGPPPEPWPDGPRRPPDRLFREVALSHFGASQLVTLGTEFAAEIFLALLIELPASRDWNNYDPIRDRLGMHDAPWNKRPPFYDFAPASILLANDAAVGLDFVVRLINFATERWAEAWPVRENRRVLGPDWRDVPALAFESGIPCVCLVLGGEKKTYLGDRRVFDWSSGTANDPCWVSAALMALEHWLYEQESRGTLSDENLRYLLSAGRSVAIIGVLFDLALKSSRLLNGPLEPLVGSMEIFYWGHVRALGNSNDNRRAALIAWWGKSAEEQKAARAWHEMSHRTEQFHSVVSGIFKVKEVSWPALEEGRRRWKVARSRLDESHFAEWLDELIAYFDPSNWHSEASQDGSVILGYTPPDVLVQRATDALPEALSLASQFRRKWARVRADRSP